MYSILLKNSSIFLACSILVSLLNDECPGWHINSTTTPFLYSIPFIKSEITVSSIFTAPPAKIDLASLFDLQALINTRMSQMFLQSAGTGFYD